MGPYASYKSNVDIMVDRILAISFQLIELKKELKN
jgi:hypothetical protein